MDQPPEAASPDRRLLDIVALALMLIGWAGLGVTLLAAHPLLAAGYVSASAAAVGVVLGISR